jgi:RNA polymerase sigma factor (sigma-70 family)
MEKFKNPKFIEKLKRTTGFDFREMVKELYPWFRSFIKKAYPSLAMETEDILQDLAVNLAEYIDDIDPKKGTFLSLSFRILRNLCIDHIKEQQRNLIESLQDFHGGIRAEPTNPVPKDDRDFVTIIESLAPESGLREAFLKLRPKDCQVIAMPFAGWTDDDIVDRLNIPSKNALWAKRSRAIAKLREQFYKINGPNRGAL